MNCSMVFGLRHGLGRIRHAPGLKVIKEFADFVRREDPLDFPDERWQFFSELGAILANLHESEKFFANQVADCIIQPESLPDVLCGFALFDPNFVELGHARNSEEAAVETSSEIRRAGRADTTSCSTASDLYRVGELVQFADEVERNSAVTCSENAGSSPSGPPTVAGHKISSTGKRRVDGPPDQNDCVTANSWFIWQWHWNVSGQASIGVPSPGVKNGDRY